MSPVPHEKLETFIRNNTVEFIKRVIVLKLSIDQAGIEWTFSIPKDTENLICHMFDLSLNCAIIDYHCGQNIYDTEECRNFWSDMITVVDSKDGKTNITPELIDAMEKRYAIVE